MEERKKYLSVYTILSVILFFALLSRLIFLFSYLNKDPFSEVLILDSLRYDLWARAILDGRLFESGAFYQAPLYPHFLFIVYWIFGHSFLFIYIIQNLVGIANIVILFLIARRYFSEWVALLSSLIFSLYGTAIFLECKLLPETIAIFINLILLYILSRYQFTHTKIRKVSKVLILWMIGIFLGISCLVRPYMLLLIPFLCLWFLFMKDWSKDEEIFSWRSISLKKIMNLLVFMSGIFLIIFPITLRNYFASGDFVPISLNGGITFAQGNNPYAKGIFTPLPGFSGEILHQGKEERYYAQAQEKSELSDMEVSAFWFRKGFQYIKEDPIQWLYLEWKKLFYFFDNYEHSLEYNYAVERHHTVNISVIPFGLIMPFAFLGILVSLPWRHRIPLMLYLSVLFLTTMLFYASSRYRFPAIPVFCLFAAHGLFFLKEISQRKEVMKVILSILLVTSVSIFSFLKRGDVYRFEEASAYGNLGTAYNSAGMFQESLSSFKRQMELDPDSAYAHFNIAVILSEMGKEGEAVKYYEKAIRINPSLAEAYNNLGIILVKWGECSEAERLFLKAINMKPFHLNPYINLIRCYLSKGEIEKIIKIKGMADRNGVKIPQTLEREIQDRVFEESFE